MKVKSILSCILLLFSLLLQAQNYTIQYDVPVKSITDIVLKNPWIGGLNNPHISNIHLNNDTILDVFIFDKVDQSAMTFISENGELRYNDLHGIVLPEINSWCLLYDFNCDDIQDLFTYSVGFGGTKIYKGYKDASGISRFSIFDQILNYTSATGTPNIYISQVDIPGIADIDFDGDTDILTFSSDGQFLEFYKNKSVELGYSCDSMVMNKEVNCWGSVKEGLLDNTITLNVACREANQDLKEMNPAHSGSSILAFDPDKDDDIDLMLGDVITSNLVYLKNNKTSGVDLIEEVHYNAPQFTISANVNTFAAAFYADVNGDNKKDLLVTPNATSGSEYFNNVWYYKNIGNTKDSFQFQNDSFLVKEMIDVGKNAYPAIVDVDNDGLLDLIVGNNSYYGYPSGTTEVSALTFYKNIGTATSPSFKMITRDWLSLRALNKTNLNPTFGDLDNDNKIDLLLGNTDGRLIFLRNNAPINAPMSFDSPIDYYDSIDVGSYSAPQIVDLDEDGKNDLLIGEIQGRIYHYQNIGSSSVPDFLLKTNFLGEVSVKDSLSSTGYSKPLFYKDTTLNKWILLVGSEKGNIYQYENIDDNLEGVFIKVNSQVANYTRSKQSDLARADLNNDGYQELLVGTMRGGLYYYTSDPNAVSVEEESLFENIQIFPSPAQDFISIQSESDIYPSLLNIYSTDGKLVQTQTIFENNRIDISNLSQGLFVLELINGKNHFTSKFIHSK